MTLISRRQALFATSAFALFPSIGHADDWPKARPVRAIVPFAAGSSTDILARTVLDEVSKLTPSPNLSQTATRS